MTLARTNILSALLISSTLSAPALAADGSYPSFSHSIVAELQGERTTSSDVTPNEDNNNVFWRTEYYPTLSFNKQVSLTAVAVLEPVKGIDPTKDNYFKHEGAYFEELKLQYDGENWGAFGGKIHPSFGKAWDWGRGIWGEDFAEDYEIVGTNGVGGYTSFGSETAGEHRLEASLFTQDRSILSKSVFTSTPRVKLSDGGSANTNSLSSYAVSVDGENSFGVKSLGYHIGYASLADADKDPADSDSKGFTANLSYTASLGNAFASDLLAEYAAISNAGGGPDDAKYVTLSAVNHIMESWLLTASWTGRTLEVSGGSDVDDSLFQLTGGYDFGEGLTAEAGWRTAEESTVDESKLGALIRYQREF